MNDSYFSPLPQSENMPIDVDFDFTSDTPFFWEGFWDRNDGLGYCGNDPDSCSPTLREYHRILWSRELPNGQTMDLRPGYGSDYLVWNSMRFASDSITTGFRYKRMKPLIDLVEESMEDYRGWMESMIRRSYTMGGMIIFPKHRNSINQCRGTNRMILDRWDLTLECIRRFYSGEESPLSWCLEHDRAFFDLFVDFRGYVDYFLLQDCVSEDYTEVRMWLDTELFAYEPAPRDVDEYLAWIQSNLDFVARRNKRIADLARRMGH